MLLTRHAEADCQAELQAVGKQWPASLSARQQGAMASWQQTCREMLGCDAKTTGSCAGSPACRGRMKLAAWACTAGSVPPLDKLKVHGSRDITCWGRVHAKDTHSDLGGLGQAADSQLLSARASQNVTSRRFPAVHLGSSSWAGVFMTPTDCPYHFPPADWGGWC